MTGTPYSPSWPAARLGPSRAWYALAAGVILAGFGVLAALIVLGVTRFGAEIAQLDRVDVPGSQQLYLDHAGTYTVYYETAGAPHEPPRPFQADVVDPNGNPVAVRPASGSETYQAAGHHGMALATFDAPQSGLYVVTVSAVTPESGSDVAVGRVDVGAFVLTLLGGVFVALVGALVGTLIGVLTFVGRLRARRALW